MLAAPLLGALVKIQRAVQATTAVRDSRVVLGVACVLARVEVRRFRQVLLEEVEDPVKGVADARLSAQPRAGVVRDREVLVFVGIFAGPKAALTSISHRR